MRRNRMQRFRQFVRRQLTLRIRLTLLVSGLVFLLSTALVLFFILTVTATISTQTQFAMPDPPVPAPTVAPGQPTPTPLPRQDNTQSAQETTVFVVPQEAIQQLQRRSLLGLGLILLLGGFGAFWLAGQALRPVRRVSRTAQRISAGTLDTRLALKHPDDELKELADAFDAMLDRLERSFHHQAQFVSDAAHELRTPLATLRTNLEITRTDPDATLDDYQEMAQTVEQALLRLERLVADLLILANDEGVCATDEVILGPLLEEVVHHCTPLAEDYGVIVQIVGESDVSVRGNERLLARVFRNLIENGIRYNRPGGTVVVTLTKEDTWAIVTISDTGAGIPPEEQERIFDRFYRTDSSRERQQGGAGLGLAIVTHLIRHHNGRIDVESTPGVGSTFYVRLPL